MKADHYQYIELSSMGIESLAVMNICNHLFSNLTALMPQKGLESMKLIDTVDSEDKYDSKEKKIDGEEADEIG